MSADGLNWSTDLVHAGQLFRRVRRGRGLKASQIAAATGLSAASISRLETGSRSTPLAVDSYVQALVAPTTPGALSPMQADFLRDAVEHSRAAREREAEIAPLSFEMARRGGNAALERLLRRLAHDEVPGSLTDILGFVHATNWQALHLFGVDADREFLGQWQAWHGVARVIAPQSPLGRVTVGEHVPVWANRIMHLARRHLFNLPFNALVARLGEMLPDEFPGAWQAATSLLLPYRTLAGERTCRLDGGTVTVGFEVGGEADVGPTPDHATILTLHLWQPRNDGAHRLVQRLASDRRSGELYFASDFDRGDFHINAWLAQNPPRSAPLPRV